jgi:hypothetical protein
MASCRLSTIQVNIQCCNIKPLTIRWNESAGNVYDVKGGLLIANECAQVPLGIVEG